MSNLFARCQQILYITNELRKIRSFFDEIECHLCIVVIVYYFFLPNILHLRMWQHHYAFVDRLAIFLPRICETLSLLRIIKYFKPFARGRHSVRSDRFESYTKFVTVWSSVRHIFHLRSAWCEQEWKY